MTVSEGAGVFPAVPTPDAQARRAAVARQEQLTKPAGSLGRLEELGVWVASCQGTCPPRPVGRPRVAVVGRGTGIDDAGWMRKAAAIRDALRRARKVVGDPMALLRTSAGADLAAMAGFLAQAAVRRTPVVLDGMVVTAAALIADQLAP